MQVQTPAQQILIPPDCTLGTIFTTDACKNSWNVFNQAKQQQAQEQFRLYVTNQATAPLQQQIAGLSKLATDQQNQLKSLQEQMQANSMAAIQSQITSHNDGFRQGSFFGVGATLILFALVFVIKRLTGGFTITKKAQTNAASAS